MTLHFNISRLVLPQTEGNFLETVATLWVQPRILLALLLVESRVVWQDCHWEGEITAATAAAVPFFRPQASCLYGRKKSSTNGQFCNLNNLLKIAQMQWKCPRKPDTDEMTIWKENMSD